MEKIEIRIRTTENGKQKIWTFDNDAAAAIEFLQGVPRARDAAAHNADIVASNQVALKQLKLFNESFKKHFK